MMQHLYALNIDIKPLKRLKYDLCTHQHGLRQLVRGCLGDLLADNKSQAIRFYVIEPLSKIQGPNDQLLLRSRIKLLHHQAPHALAILVASLQQKFANGETFRLLENAHYQLDARVIDCRVVPLDPKVSLEQQSYQNLWQTTFKPEFTMSFASPTGFGTGNNAHGLKRETYSYPLPDPVRIFESLAKTWQLFAPPELMLPERVLEIVDSHLQIVRIRHLEVHKVRLGYEKEKKNLKVDGQLKEQPTLKTKDNNRESHEFTPILHTGFVGEIHFKWCSPPETEICRQMMVLARYAEWAGVGRKPTLGAGYVPSEV